MLSFYGDSKVVCPLHLLVPWWAHGTVIPCSDAAWLLVESGAAVPDRAGGRSVPLGHSENVAVTSTDCHQPPPSAVTNGHRQLSAVTNRHRQLSLSPSGDRASAAAVLSPPALLDSLPLRVAVIHGGHTAGVVARGDFCREKTPNGQVRGDPGATSGRRSHRITQIHQQRQRLTSVSKEQRLTAASAIGDSCFHGD